MRKWLKAKLKLFVIAGIVILLVLFTVSFVGGYWLKWGWTGFPEHIGPNTPQYQPAKTLWDWLNLLGVFAIPAAILWFTVRQAQVSKEENIDNQREAEMQAFIDKILNLEFQSVLSKGPAIGVKVMAEERTKIVLRRLDLARKVTVLQFLYDRGLIYVDQGPINLHGANLSEADMSGFLITSICLSKTSLCQANLSKAKLRLADLSGANLSGANLNGVDLSSANLEGADLSGANLDGADLGWANLDGADLSFAKNTTTEQLDDAQSLKGAIMPDGSIHP